MIGLQQAARRRCFYTGLAGQLNRALSVRLASLRLLSPADCNVLTAVDRPE
jgi:hypothetical protein